MDPSNKKEGRDLLIHTIRSTPIIDNHAHPLLNLDDVGRYPLLSITTEAHGDAIHAARTSLSHLRGVKQLALALQCAPTWEAVVSAIEHRRLEDYDKWIEQCLFGLETVLVDDGLDSEDEVLPYSYLSRLTQSPCKRIVRIEQLAAQIIDSHCEDSISPDSDVSEAEDVFNSVVKKFDETINKAIADTEVVGFKSVICYRTGLAIPSKPDVALASLAFASIFSSRARDPDVGFRRLQHPGLNEFFVHRLAFLVSESEGFKKPIQFHTGLGDNDITLNKSSPSHLQEFIRAYPKVPIILLHASYPFTREAGYLASVYSNVYADIGEVFPFVSRDGQEKIVRQILELCPWSKILWSTDGHWFPETYYLAIIQIREVLQKVSSPPSS
jgi:hypothetical protein